MQRRTDLVATRTWDRSRRQRCRSPKGPSSGMRSITCCSRGFGSSPNTLCRSRSSLRCEEAEAGGGGLLRSSGAEAPAEDRAVP